MLLSRVRSLPWWGAAPQISGAMLPFTCSKVDAVVAFVQVVQGCAFGAGVYSLLRFTYQHVQRWDTWHLVDWRMLTGCSIHGLIDGVCVSAQEYVNITIRRCLLILANLVFNGEASTVTYFEDSEEYRLEYPCLSTTCNQDGVATCPASYQ
jgi:hypothetical protein